MIARLKAWAATPTGRQVGRFARLGLTSAVAIWIAGGQQLTKDAVVAAVIGGVEVVYRAIRPAKPAGSPVGG